jgi:hypothetical protein
MAEDMDINCGTIVDGTETLADRSPDVAVPYGLQANPLPPFH